jgi:hypothetical protein
VEAVEARWKQGATHLKNRKQEGSRKEAGRKQEGSRKEAGRKQEGSRKEAGRKQGPPTLEEDADKNATEELVLQWRFQKSF